MASKSANFLFGKWLSEPPPGDEVVISGMSGQFPESTNIYEFRDNLFNKTDMVTEDGRRWTLDHPEIPKRAAKIYNIDKFDGGFFGIHYRQADIMEPMMRKFMETAVEAIIDAGVNPSELEGTNTGVFVGTSWADMENSTLMGITKPQKFGITGYLKFFIAHRISYYLKLKGPSYIVDSACSSSFNALEHAFKAIRIGQCENALVGGTQLVLHPGGTLGFSRLGVLSADGTCKVFDEDANGFVRGETIACVFLQKAKNSKRIYAQIIHTKVNSDGFKEESITFPSFKIQQQLLSEVYGECSVHPSDLCYLEAHGTATQVGDTEEVKAIDLAIAQGRQAPLLIGSVKSNIGHAEPASGIGSLVKVLIAMEAGYISPNIHLKKIKKGITALEEGRLKVVTETAKLEGEAAIVGINNFGFGGNNCHLVLRQFNKMKTNGGQPENDIPRLICVSGRTEESVLKILNNFNERPIDIEYVALIHQLFKTNFSEHLYRGYSIISKEGPIKTSIKLLNGRRRSFYINFGKSEHIYKSIGRCFLELPVFKAAILRINEILGTNIISIIHNKRRDFEDDLLGTIAVQMAFTVLLKYLNLKPSGILENTYEKLICSYFDDEITLKEALFKALNLAKQPPELSLTEQKWYFLKNKNVAKTDCNSVEYDASSKKSINSFILNLTNFEENGLVGFLDFLGRLYETGYNPQIQKLYTKIEYPVSRGTPMISPLIKWNHDKSWYTYKYDQFTVSDSEQIEYNLSQLDENYSYISGHMIDGRNLIPATSYLNLVWQTFARSRRMLPLNISVVFENCKFIRAVTMSRTGYIKLLVSIQHGSGNFEVLDGSSLIIMSGRIYIASDISHHQSNLAPIPFEEGDLNQVLQKDDIYKELSLRNYNYSDLFRGIERCDVDATTGLIKWENNWATFMDTMLQIKLLQYDRRFLYIPTSIKKLTIDPAKHLTMVQNKTKPLLPVYVYNEPDVIKSGGIEICGPRANSISKRKPMTMPVLETYEFVPNKASLNLTESARVNIQIILENTLERNVAAVEIVDDFTRMEAKPLLPVIFNVLQDIPLVIPDLTVSIKNTFEEIGGVKFEPVTLTSNSNLLLIIATNILQRSNFLELALSALNKNGFIITREKKYFSSRDLANVEILTEHETEHEKLILFTRPKIDNSTKFIEVSSEHFAWLPELKKALKMETNVIVYNQNHPTDGILGLVNCIRREPRGNRVHCFFIMDKAPPFNPEDPFYKQQIQKKQAVNVYKNSKWGTYRHLLLEDNAQESQEHSYVTVTTKGDLSSLKWVEGPLTTEKENQNLISTYYVAINFKDIMTASGRINVTVKRNVQDNIEGFEYSGRDLNGKRVMGILNNGALSTLVTPSDIIWSVPHTWSLEEAATVPIAYCTVVYALLIRTTLKHGTSILIHSATGGVGIAALNVATFHGCDVFVTVGTQEKRDFLKKNFPQIPRSHIGNSHDTSFVEMIKLETQGRGVDIILNSLAEEKLEASLGCLARGGSFMEIGQFDLTKDNSLNLLLLEKEASYHGIMIDALIFSSAQIKMEVAKLICEGIEKGYVKPLPTTVFSHDKVNDAFKYMFTGKHIGKVLIKVRDEEKEEIIKPPKKLIKSIPKFYCNPDRTYLIVGGLGGFGLELADWLVLRGAKKLVLTSRSGIQTGYQTQKIKTWKSFGVTIHISTIDIASKRACTTLITEATKFAPIDAIFNLAIVLKDALFQDQSEEDFKISLAPKAYATKLLDEVTRELCPKLRYFVVFSSVCCGRGNAGQTNYGMANSIMERICEKRKQDGFPALAIQWGAIGDVGQVAQMQRDNKEVAIGGILQQKISSCLDVMNKLLKQDNAIVASMVVAAKVNKGFRSGSAANAVANALGIKDIKTVNHHATLAELGMDSMMTTEIIQLLENEFEIYLTFKDIRSLTFSRLIELETKNQTNTLEKNVKKVEQGTNLILRFIPDSKFGIAPIVRLQNQVKMTDEAPIVILLPGIEGVLKLLNPLTKNLRAHVFGVQYSYKNPEDSIGESVKIALPHIEEKISKKLPFYIIGYSYGAILALELVSLLESKGFVGNVLAIDGSPNYISSSLRHFMFEDSDVGLQTMLLYNALATILPEEVLTQNKDKLMGCPTFDDRINFAKSLIPSQISDLQKLEKQAVVTLYKRLKTTLNYNFANEKIKSSVKLYKAKYPMIHEIEYDYKLSELCEKAVEVCEIEGNHETILEQPELIEDINATFTQIGKI